MTEKEQESMERARFDYAIVATDVVIFSVIEQRLHVLLIKMKREGFKGLWAAPGGLMGVTESPEETVSRVLEEKTGLKDVFAEQLATFGAVDRDPLGRVVSIAYLALIHADHDTLRTTDEYDAVEWHPVDDLPKLAYDHVEVIDVARSRLKARLSYTNIVRNILPEYFTLTEMQLAYEIILDDPIDKRNFRKKILSLGIVQKTKKMRTGERSRPAALYTFTTDKFQIIDIL